MSKNTRARFAGMKVEEFKDHLRRIINASGQPEVIAGAERAHPSLVRGPECHGYNKPQTKPQEGE
jgi:hypothetical protein